MEKPKTLRERAFDIVADVFEDDSEYMSVIQDGGSFFNVDYDALIQVAEKAFRQGAELAWEACAASVSACGTYPGCVGVFGNFDDWLKEITEGEK